MFGIDGDQDGDDSEPLPVIIPVDQEKEGWIVPKHKKDFRPLFKGEARIPPSLERALKTFVISSAVRHARGQGSKHCSMLIHVSRFKDVHQRIFEQIDDWLTDFKRKVRYGVGRDAILADMHRLWTAEIEPTAMLIRASDMGSGLPATTWSEIAASLADALDKIRPRSSTADRRAVPSTTRRTTRRA